MQFTTENVDVNGTSLRGYIKTTRAAIEAVFGAPDETYDDKVTTEWDIQFEDGTIATIYDWKLGFAPGMDEKYEWHIGGKSFDAVERVEQALGVQ